MNQSDLQPETILNNIMGGIIICNYSSATLSSEVVYINTGWTAITGYTLEELAREKDGNPQALVFQDDKPRVDAEYSEQIGSGQYELMYRIVHKDGSMRWIIDKGVMKKLPGGDMQNQSIITEVTAIKEQEERLRLLAQIDQLTDLNNKATFTVLVQTVLSRQNERCHAMLLLDIDNFKGLNDSYGHAFGDKVLAAVAMRLKGLFRSRDVLGRIGGDEFMVLMTDVTSADAVTKKACKICRAVSEIRIPGTQHFPVTVSIGSAFFTDGKSYESLFDEADAALYRAKNNGKNQYVVGTPD